MSIEFQALSDAVYSSKYQLTDKNGNKVDKDRFDTFKRVAKALAIFEKDPVYWEEEFYRALCFGAVPAGRITSNAGAGEHKPNTSLINCIVSDTIYDSISGIGQAVKDSLVSLATGAGIGYCFSTLRPKGSYVSGVGACFTEDTEILDVNCNSISFKDLEQKLKSEEVYTFSAYPDGSLKVSKILKCWVTKQAKTYVKVTLDTGEVIKCTTDHKFLLRSGEYISAINLIPNMSLMPLYHKTMARHNDKNLRNYVLDNSSGKYTPVYKLSSRRTECESVQIQDAVKMCIHHKDFNSLNDAPTNLVFMTESDHFRLHTLVRNADPVFQAHIATTAKERADKLWEKFKTNPEAFAEWQRKQAEFRDNTEWKQKQSLVARRSICSKTVIEKRIQNHKEYIQQNREIFNEEQNRRALKGQETRINSVITELKQRGMELTSSNFDQIGLSKSNGCSISFKKAMKVRPDLLIDFINNKIDPYSRSEKRCETCINKVLTELKLRNVGKTISSFIQIMEELYDPAYLNWSMIKHHFPDFPSLLSEYNHTVQKVELCTSENLLDFYDLEVDTSLHNFPLACGVFVHNSTSGALPFADIFDKGCFTIASAGGRRGAQMATFDVRHPDVIDFVKVKREDGRFRQFNISALIPNEFFNEEKTWQFRFPLRQTDPFIDPSNTMWDYWHVNDEQYVKNEEGLTLFKKYGEIDKEELWNLILKSNYDFAEPGILFIDKINRENNLWFCEDIQATNPCVTGDTKIAVAGQGAVAIKDLAETGMDVPVFCQNLKTGAIEVSMGRNPRKTGEKQKVYKVVLDDGSSFKTTENHGLYLRDGTKVKVSELTVGDSLLPFHQRVNYVPDTYVKSIGQWVKEQHLLLNYKDNTLYNFGTGRGKYHAHHIDGDHTNNTLSNLQALLHEEHNSLHLTQKNPMQVWWPEQTDERKELYRQRMSRSVSGENNGMYGKMHTDKTKALIGTKTSERFLDEDFKSRHLHGVLKSQTDEWKSKVSLSHIKEREIIKTYCAVCTEPFQYERIVGSGYVREFCSRTCVSFHASQVRAEQVVTEQTRQLIGLKSKEFANTQQGKQAKSLAGKKSIQQRAMKCGSYLLSKGYELTKDTWDSLKEVLHKGGIKPTISSNKIVDYWDGDWSKFVCDCEDFNHKVLNVEFVGYEDVYNITVDKHHNYFIVTNEFEKNGNSHYSGILSQNCGEQPLPPSGACLLGSIDLTRFVSDPFTDAARFDYDLFIEVVETFTRMLDNVVELNNLPLPAQREELYRKRRHGMGFFGLGSALTMLGIPYNSKQALEFGENIAVQMALTGFVTGVELAEEKGPAPIMNESFTITPEMARFNDFAKQHIGETFTGKELFLQSEYMQRLIRLKPSLEDAILKRGCRFTHHYSIAPTGTISLAMGNGASGGVEPSFAHQYFRNVTTEGKKTRQQESVYSKEFLVYKNLPINQGKSDEELLAELPDYFVTADSIHWKAHVEMLAAIQPWVDSSISKCVEGSTLVPTNYGLKRMDELSKVLHTTHDSFEEPLTDLKVLCPDGKMRNVTNHYFGGEKQCKKIRFNNGYELTASLTHRVKTPFGWKTFGELLVGDSVLCSSDVTEYEGVAGHSLPEATYEGHYSKPILIPTQVTTDFSLFVGMWLADGSLTESNGAINFTNSDDFVIDQYVELIVELFSINPKIVYDTRSSKKLRTVTFASKRCCQWLKGLCGHKAGGKKIPDQIMTGSRDELLALLKGLSLDGYNLDNATCIYEGKSYLLAKQLFEISFVLGLEPRFGKKWVNTHNYYVYGVRIYGFNGCLESRKDSGGKHDRLVPIPNEVYTLEFDRSHPQRVVLGVIQRGERYSGSIKEATLIKLGVAYDPTIYSVLITDIEDVVTKVYDITVEESHDYSLGGIWSHNTINLPSDISFDEFKDVYQYAYSVGCKAVSTYRYNPETLGSILSRTSDLEKSRYEFTLNDGTVIVCKGNDQITYDGESTTAENLFNALKEKTYGKF